MTSQKSQSDSQNDNEMIYLMPRSNDPESLRMCVEAAKRDPNIHLCLSQNDKQPPKQRTPEEEIAYQRKVDEILKQLLEDSSDQVAACAATPKMSIGGDFKSIRQAAQAGDSLAQYKLGLMYARGHGVVKDDAEAVLWYRMAAEKGNGKAQYELGSRYLSGGGVAKDEGEGVAWYRKAAEQGDSGAQFNLGACYLNGRGVVRDDALALYWYRKAAEDPVHNIAACCSLGWIFQNGDGAIRDDEQAFSWYRKAADKGDAFAQYHVGVMYEEGHGVPQDFFKAAEWYGKAAEQSNLEAQVRLGSMYLCGRGVVRNEAEAASWFSSAAEDDEPSAQYHLGMLYETGRGVAKDDAAAVAWYQRAAGQEHAAAQFRLGLMLRSGRGVARNEPEALRWFRKAADRGHAEAIAALATPEAEIPPPSSSKFPNWDYGGVRPSPCGRLPSPAKKESPWSSLIKNRSLRMLKRHQSKTQAKLAALERALAANLGRAAEASTRLPDISGQVEALRSRLSELHKVRQPKKGILSIFVARTEMPEQVVAEVRSIEKQLLTLEATRSAMARLPEDSRSLESRIQRERSVLAALEEAIRRRQRKKNELQELRAAAAANSTETRRVASTTRRFLANQDACPYCGGHLGSDPHADHIYPVAKGGRSSPQNMVLVCSRCNMMKRDMTLTTFMNAYGLDRNAIEARLRTLGKDY